ncbi:MAG: hypothetical protein MUE30_05400 [Spirosomaceae bacterium]|nr:hypothetical protein [Spirosomataceae bacterium]
MNALRQIISPENGKLLIEIPKEYQQKRFEVIVLPIDEPADKDEKKLAMAHKIIDIGLAVSDDFVSDFEQYKKDRSLPFRDE